MRPSFALNRAFKRMGYEKDWRAPQVTVHGLEASNNWHFFNGQNGRILSPDTLTDVQRGLIVNRYEHPPSVMFWSKICATWKPKLVFVELSVNINSKYYKEMFLKKEMNRSAKIHHSNPHCTFQKDSAPAHIAKTTNKDRLQNSNPDFISTLEWPPYSPNRNHLVHSKKAELKKEDLLDSSFQLRLTQDCPSGNAWRDGQLLPAHRGWVLPRASETVFKAKGLPYPQLSYFVLFC